MSYYHASSHSAKRRSYVTTVGLIVIFIVFGIMTVIGFFYREHFKSSLKPVAEYTEQLTRWLGSQKKHLAQKSSSVMAAVEKEKPVHFEFYSTLPEMAVNIPKESNAKESAAQNKNGVRVAKNVKQDTSPFASSRDNLVREFADKLDDSE